MDRGTKRRHGEPGGRSQDSRISGIGEFVQLLKKPRLSQESELTTAQSDLHTTKAEDDLSADGVWQTFTSKASRRKNNRKAKESEDGSYPQVVFNHKIVTPIRIADLQDLVLYILADGVSPQWLAVRNTKAIHKVVVVMVPGLEKGMLDSVTPQDSSSGRNGHDTGNTNLPPKDQENSDAQSQSHQSGVRSPHSEMEDTCSSEQWSPSQHSAGWMIKSLLPVKAPGDSRYSKIHSPLQAMLLSANSDSVQKKNTKLPDQASFQDVRTPITHFVHTSDELRDAEYPIHPASFTASQDAHLEAERRVRTNQSDADGWMDTAVAGSIPVPATSVSDSHESLTQGLDIYALDCEMVLTIDDVYSLARVSILSWSGAVVLDKLVKPSLPVKNYFTQYSGITPELLSNITTSLQDVQSELKSLFTSSTILLGHSLESDLNAMKMTHPFIIDTSLVYPHPRGLPLRSSLKFLANKYLRREIQTGADGHDSVEDARAVLDLIKLKCEKGLKWGTSEANGEPIFRRLARSKTAQGLARTSAIVEYGTPERGFGREATYAVACQNDEEILTGMLRAIHGDVDGKQIPAGGVDFIWARLRELEFARGWVTGRPPPQSLTEKQPAETAPPTTTDTSESPPIHPQPSQPPAPDFQSEINTLLSRLHTLHAALPLATLLILFSGTGDMRDVLRLQLMQQQYRREFKIKKWDELSVKWTDEEEQELRRAVDKARQGWGVVLVN